MKGRPEVKSDHASDQVDLFRDAGTLRPASSCFIPNDVPGIVKDAIAREINLPMAHYAHPVDSGKRTAMCGAPILGIGALEPFRLCPKRVFLLDAVDWSLLPAEYGEPPDDEPQPSF